MKKTISLILALIMMCSMCMPVAAFGFGKEDTLRIVVPENWEMNIGDSRTVEAVFSAGVTDRVLSWSADPADIASVDEWGRVTALKEGKATITAKTDAGLMSSAVLTVTAESTKSEKANKEKHDYEGEAIEENDVLQKIVTRYGKDSAEVPEFIKNESTYEKAKGEYEAISKMLHTLIKKIKSEI